MVNGQDQEELMRLNPIAKMGQKNRMKAVSNIRILDVERGFKVRSDQNKMVFLLRGRMSLSQDGRLAILEENDPRTRDSIFQGASDRSQAVASKPSTLAVLDRDVYESMQREVEDEERGQSTVDAVGLDSEMFTRIYTLAHSGEIALPQMPEVAFRVQQVSQDPNASIQDLGKIIKRDVSIAARLVGFANSPIMGSQRRIATLDSAIVRLGITRTRQLIMALSMHQVFISEHERCRPVLERIWRSSAEVAALSALLARETGVADAEVALFAGLLHRIGTLPVIAEVERGCPECSTRDCEWIIYSIEGPVANLVGQYWGLDARVRDAIRDARSPEQTDDSDLTQVVRVAQAACMQGSGDMETDGRTALEELASIKEWGLEVDESGELSLVKASRKEIEDMVSFLD